jgi:hypothetical protein
MSRGNPRDVPPRQVRDGVFPLPRRRARPGGDEKIRPPGNAAVFQAARRGPRFASRLNVQGRQAIWPGTAAGTAPGSPARASRTTAGSGSLAREDLPSGPSGENLAVAQAPAARS